MNIMEELVRFEDKDGVENYFIKNNNKQILVWQKTDNYAHSYKTKIVDLSKVDEEILTEANLWDRLPKSLKETIVFAQDKEKEIKRNRMAHARKGRRKKNPDLPTELVCKCGHKVKANWTVLNNKADKLGVPAIDLAKNYQCQKCNPTKGRRKKK